MPNKINKLVYLDLLYRTVPFWSSLTYLSEWQQLNCLERSVYTVYGAFYNINLILNY